MGDSSAAALSLLEALIEQLEAEAVLTPEDIADIYDRALVLAQSRPGSDAEAVAALRAGLGSKRH